MKTVTETSRLYLRELTPDDAQSFYALNADPEVIRYTGDAAFDSVMAAKDFLTSYVAVYAQYKRGRWAVIRKSNGEFLGWCGLKYHPEENITDLGFRFFRQFWNHGYATESAAACLHYGFNKLGLTEIHGHAMTANAASVRVLEKLGFTFVRNITFSGSDGVMYSLAKNNFNATQTR